jgi:hypothetical protein
LPSSASTLLVRCNTLFISFVGPILMSSSMHGIKLLLFRLNVLLTIYFGWIPFREHGWVFPLLSVLGLLVNAWHWPSPTIWSWWNQLGCFGSWSILCMLLLKVSDCLCDLHCCTNCHSFSVCSWRLGPSLSFLLRFCQIWNLSILSGHLSIAFCYLNDILKKHLWGCFSSLYDNIWCTCWKALWTITY